MGSVLSNNTEGAEGAEEIHEPNLLLRRQREMRGWSQKRVALELQQMDPTAAVTEKDVARWERGKRRPGPYYRAKLCLLFGVSAYELGLAGPEPELPPPRADQQQFVVLTRGELAMLSELFSLIRGNTMANFDPAKRETLQKLLQLLKNAGITIGGFQLIDLEQFERLAGALKKPSRIDAKTLNGLRNTTANYWQIRRYGSIASPDLLSAAKEHYQIVTQLLQGSLFPTTRTSLSAIASETALLEGMLSVDMNQPDAARTYYQLALDCAQGANDDALFAAVLGRMSTVPAAVGAPREALLLLQEAQLMATQGDVFTLRSWLAAEEAEAQADLKHTDACSKALENVERFVGLIQPEEKTYGAYFDGARLPAYRGACFMRLEQSDVAMPALTEALKKQPDAGAFTRAILLDLATTSCQAGEIEQACSYVHQSLDIIEQTNATRYLQRVYRLRQQLEPWSTVQDVKDLDKRLRRVKKLAEPLRQ